MIKKKEKPLLEVLYDGMHNWWTIGVYYDWKTYPETGKYWVYKDCSGIEIKTEDPSVLERKLRKLNE